MPRVNRFYLQGNAWQITHRYHKLDETLHCHSSLCGNDKHKAMSLAHSNEEWELDV